ncbi:molybdate ABC transporter permease subunit [Aureibacter tunicatorum]|uniref:Molybdenum transport system permease n=1 Tax=Aureibacter tunicatorum TaxID=866807 RepID=A0AAE4BSQ3_9BACT|nr:molybdate ABC transporter permease subunit [Aureibacter tunicatorum]MDR6238662.1 molybdate transport system permease protein [Aureibacter tunicatorum]BDD05407.1 molybdenum ABC transporter permease subunit [Aureibacter tunicatorum]
MILGDIIINDWEPIWLTLKLALVSTLMLFVFAVPLALWLGQTKSKLKPFWEALVSMPLVLPPSVIGFYLLLLLSPRSVLGSWLENWFDVKLVFTFEGLVIGSMIYSLPFMVHPIQSAITNFPQNLLDASYVLGKSKIQTFRRVVLPMIKPSLLTGLVLTFAHTIGEFGVILMIGGNIPGETRVASIAIYNEVESLNYSSANFYSAVLFGISFAILFVIYMLNGKSFSKIWNR